MTTLLLWEPIWLLKSCNLIYDTYYRLLVALLQLNISKNIDKFIKNILYSKEFIRRINEKDRRVNNIPSQDTFVLTHSLFGQSSNFEYNICTNHVTRINCYKIKPGTVSRYSFVKNTKNHYNGNRLAYIKINQRNWKLMAREKIDTLFSIFFSIFETYIHK